MADFSFSTHSVGGAECRKGTGATSAEERARFQRRRILWINPAPLDVHLYQTSSLEILKRMERKGYTLVFITTRSKNKVRLSRSLNPRASIVSVPLRSVPLLSSVMFAIWCFLFLPFYIIVTNPHFIIATQPEASILAFIPNLLFSKVKKTKFVLDVRSIPVETVGFRGFQQKLWFDISILVAKKLFDGMTIITQPMRNEICNTYEISPSNVGVWSSGVNTRLFSPESCASDGARLKKKLGLSSKFVVFYHGVFTANRGLEETVESIKMLSPDYSDVVLFLLGTGPTATKLRDLVQKEGLQGQVVIHDRVNYNEVPKFIEMSDVCIVPLPDHPYWRFQSPLNLLEYLAMGKVVIVTDIPAHRTVIDEKKCGIYTSSIAPIEIAKSIVYAYDNRERLVEWGKTGRTIVNERYEWEKVAEDLENYLLSIDDVVD